MKKQPPVYHSELNSFLEQALGYMQVLIREGSKTICPFYIIFPFEGDSELHRFDFGKEKDCDHDGHSQFLDALDLHLTKRMKKKPAPKYAIVGYTQNEDNKSYIVLEGYGQDPEGSFKVTQTFRLAATGKATFGKEATLEYYSGHNPMLQVMDRSGMKKGKFTKA